MGLDVRYNWTVHERHEHCIRGSYRGPYSGMYPLLGWLILCESRRDTQGLIGLSQFLKPHDSLISQYPGKDIQLHDSRKITRNVLKC